MVKRGAYKKLYILLLALIVCGTLWCFHLREGFQEITRKLYPVGFSFPEEKMITYIPEKTKLLSDIIPGRVSNYTYKTEEEYYNEYRTSIFATTTKKNGWDCLRHYEIIGNGSIPYFPGIEDCPKNTMTLFPKELVVKGNELYKRISAKGINDLSEDERTECNQMIQSHLDHMRAHLTTTKMAEYILDKAGKTNVSSILFISAKTEPDYLRCTILHGFKSLLGNKCHDYPKIEHIYKSGETDYTALYGRGFTYTNLLDQSMYDNALDNTIKEDIENKKYDIVIYGTSWHANALEFNTQTGKSMFESGRPYYDSVRRAYKPEEVILLCGYDIHDCDYENEIQHGNHIFVREL